MNTLNLESILNASLAKSKYGTPELDSDAYANIIKAMQDACNQILDLVVENVEINIINGAESGRLSLSDIFISKESILELKFDGKLSFPCISSSKSE